MQDLYIVDGYNLIFNYYKEKHSKGSILKKISAHSLSYLREKIIRELVQFKNYIGCKVVIVFDAKKSKNLAQNREEIDNVLVIFSKIGETADSIVEKIVYENESKNEKFEKIFVVTSDYLQQKVVFRHNIYRKSVREFAIELNNIKKYIKESLDVQKQGLQRSFYQIEKRLDKKTKKSLEVFRILCFNLLIYLIVTFVLIFNGCGLFYFDEKGHQSNEVKNKNFNEDEATYADTAFNIFLVSEVIDGDTFVTKNGEIIRLLGINAPEIDRYYYEEAKEVLGLIINGKSVKLEKDITDIDEYGRLLRYVYLDALFVNLEMVKRGFANVFTVPPDIKYSNILIEAERFARTNGLGLWSKSSIGGIEIFINFDAEGDDKTNLNGEYVKLKNCNLYDIDINGWSIKDEATNIYDFKKFKFVANSEIILFTGSGIDNKKEGKFYWCSTKPIWNNDHDTLYLRDHRGLLIEIYSY